MNCIKEMMKIDLLRYNEKFSLPRNFQMSFAASLTRSLLPLLGVFFSILYFFRIARQKFKIFYAAPILRDLQSFR